MKNGAKRAKVVNEDRPRSNNASILVGIHFMGKDVFLGDPFAVKEMVEDALRKVESIKVTRSDRVLMYCMSRITKGKCIVSWNYWCEVERFDLQNRPPVKGVISGVAVEMEAENLKYQE